MPTGTNDADNLDHRVGVAVESALKGKYTRKGAVGRGAYGQVWLVIRDSDQSKCVAKVMAMEKMHRYEQEVQCLASCNHFGIVRLVDKFTSAIGPVIILEYADGGDLSKYVKAHVAAKKDLFPEDYIGVLFIQLVLSVHHIHVRRMMHRDIKSANVLMHSTGIVKMSDFGFSRQFDGTVSQNVADTFLGTPYYLAPELWNRQKYSKKADVWSLGVVLYELMTLKRPFVSSSMRGLMQSIVSGTYERPSSVYSGRLIDVLAAMLCVDPVRRPSTADLLQMPVMRSFVDQFLRMTTESTKISSKDKEEILSTTREQMGNLTSAAVTAAVTAPDDDVPEEKVIYEGEVQIGSTREWKPRYIVLNDEALVVTRVRQDRRSQKLELSTILKVAPADSTNGENVLIVSLQTNYTVWIKANSDDERDLWIRHIEAAMRAALAK